MRFFEGTKKARKKCLCKINPPAQAVADFFFCNLFTRLIATC
jgi:hypothetical protein